MNKKLFGGKPIDSGTYGCVFKPALSCKRRKRKKGVSKLMLTNYAMKEMKLLQPIYHLMEKYPDIKSHIIIPSTSYCTPSKLSSDDLNNFNITCSKLNDIGFNDNTINQRLHELKLLHMEDGGITVGDYILTMKRRQEHHIYKGIANIFKYAITPMNQHGIIHCDIKDNNILIKHNSMKLIDFGLVVIHDESTIDGAFFNGYFSKTI